MENLNKKKISMNFNNILYLWQIFLKISISGCTLLGSENGLAAEKDHKVSRRRVADDEARVTLLYITEHV